MKRKNHHKISHDEVSTLGFGYYYCEIPNWYIGGNFSDEKKTNANEYCSKCCILKEITKNMITGSYTQL